MKSHKYQSGFTLIELIIVIVILAVLAVTAAPKFLDLGRDARVAGLENVASQIEGVIELAQAKGRIAGLAPSATNPGGIQTAYILDFGFGDAEVDFRNLCPESRAEGGDQLLLTDFLQLPTNAIESRFDNQYTLIGYDVPPSGTPTNQGCYVLYDSFGFPQCTVTIVDADC